jgi:hypothetical protein
MTTEFKTKNIDKYREMVDSIKDHLEVHNGTIKEKEFHSAYDDTLPEGIDKETIEKVSKHNNAFNLATHIALGEVATDIFLEDKSVESVTAEVGYFGSNDKIQSTIHREKEYINHMAKDGEPNKINKNLVFNTTVVSVSNKGYGLKSIKKAMSEEFKELFNK